MDWMKLCLPENDAPEAATDNSKNSWERRGCFA